jgi:hypothetical protein
MDSCLMLVVMGELLLRPAVAIEDREQVHHVLQST